MGLPRHIKTDPESIREVEAYLERELVRPSTRIITPVIIGVVMLLLPGAIGVIFANWVFHWQRLETILSFVISYLVIDLILLRFLLIAIILCYQHFAREEVRRFCGCKPSCSEYSIAVLKKYPIVIAIFKVCYRVLVTCDGNLKIDNP